MLLRAIGKVFIATGVLILLFLGYQLWGTRIVAEQHQERLGQDLIEAWETIDEDAGEEELPPPPDLGDGLAVLRIPKVDVDWVVVEGVSVEALKAGPGHYPNTPLPGEKGNVVISGHRATYGAPFARFGELAEGDMIELESASGIFTYEIRETKIVRPTDVAVISNTEDNRLTLTTCHPRYSVAQRLIVVADLIESQQRQAA